MNLVVVRANELLAHALWESALKHRKAATARALQPPGMDDRLLCGHHSSSTPTAKAQRHETRDTPRPSGHALPRGVRSCTAPSAAKKVLEAALALPAEAREELVSALSISLEPVTLTPEWQSEIARRLEKIENGEAIFYDAEDHLQSLRAK